MRHPISLFLILFIALSSLNGQQPTQWRGPSANGIYPDTGLLQEWPQEGLQLLWAFSEMGEGFSSPAIQGGFIYLASMIEQTGYLFKLTMEGKLVWKKAYGPEFTERYPGSRSTVTVVGDLLYLLSGRGRLVCMKSSDGSLVWAKHLVDDLGGALNEYGFNESVVVDGDIVYCTPGGKEQSVVALQRFTGDVVWRAPGNGDKASYGTPLLIRYPSRTLLVAHTEKRIVGIDTRNGALLWEYEWPNKMLEHQNTPIYSKNQLFCFSGYGKGSVMFTLSEEGGKAVKKWENPKFDCRMGGAVLWKGVIYGSGHTNRSWQCLDWETGRELFNSTELTMGVVIAADKMLYMYDEKGVLALAKPLSEGFSIVSRMKITLGSGSQWSHPVIHKGILYIARGNSLMAYNLKK